MFAGGPGRFAGDSWRCTCSTGSAFCRPHGDSQRYPHSARVCSRIHGPLRAVKPNMPKASVTPGTTRLSARRGTDSSIQVALCGRRPHAALGGCSSPNHRSCEYAPTTACVPPSRYVYRVLQLAWERATDGRASLPCLLESEYSIHAEGWYPHLHLLVFDDALTTTHVLLRFCMGEHLASQQHDARCSQRCPQIKTFAGATSMGTGRAMPSLVM